MKIKPLDRQSVLDVAIQTSGSAEAAFDLAIKNGISISEVLDPGAELEAVEVVDKATVDRYEAKKIRPATEITAEDEENIPLGGIDYMGIEIDFIVS